MATTVVKTIGSTGDYTTIAAWIAAIPANLVTADQIWRGELLNEAFSVSGEVFNLAGKTTDANRYVELTAAAGCSVFDDANVRTNPLRYNPSNGARIISTGVSGNLGQCTVNYTRFSRLQIANTSTGGGMTAYGSFIDIDRCLFYSSSVVGGEGSISLTTGGKIRNSVVIHNASVAGNPIASFFYGASAYNCTFIAKGTTHNSGLVTAYGTTSAVFKNCYINGATTPIVNSGQASTNTNCCANVAQAGLTVAAYSTATFENVTPGSEDWRLAAGSSLIDAGATEATYAANDISGLARSGSWDAGAWEYSAVGGTNLTAAAAGASVASGTAAGSMSGGATLNAGAAGAAVASGSATANLVTPGTITIPELRAWETGNKLTSETGITVWVNDEESGTLVVKLLGLTSHATTADIVATHAAIVAGTHYSVRTRLASGAQMTWTYIAT